MILIIFLDGAALEGVDTPGLAFDALDGAGLAEVLTRTTGCGAGGGGGDMDEGLPAGSDLRVPSHAGRGFRTWLLSPPGSGFLIGSLPLGRGFLADFESSTRGVLGKEPGRDVRAGEGERVLLRTTARRLGSLDRKSTRLNSSHSQIS